MDNLHTSRLSIDVLPNELLSHVLGFLDVSPPSATTSELVNEPRLNLTRATNAPLHAASLVSRRWRQAAKPLLFKHVQFVVQKPKEQRLALSEEIRPFLDFMVDDELAKNAASFTLIVHHKKIANILGGEHTPDGFASFWNSLFNVINPSVLLIVAPAQALGSLTSCHVHLEDEWTFDTPCHYLRLEQPSKGTAKDAVDQAKQFTDAANPSLPEPADTREPSENPRATSSTLFQIRPWTKLLLNEGSFIRAYATYEWWLRNPPSILDDLLGALAPDHAPFITPSIRDFSYVGIFPMHPHFTALAQHFPRLDNLYVQLVPRNEILQDARKMKQVEAEDLWMERNNCYAMLMRELFNSPPIGNFNTLKVFESGDAADVDAWTMAVEYVKRAGNGWEIAGEGIFVRDPNNKKGHSSDEEGDMSTTFQGALTRWAWNGVARLPVSAFPLYAMQ